MEVSLRFEPLSRRGINKESVRFGLLLENRNERFFLILL